MRTNVPYLYYTTSGYFLKLLDFNLIAVYNLGISGVDRTFERGVFALLIEQMTEAELVPYMCAWDNIKRGYLLREIIRKGHHSLRLDVCRKKHPKKQKKFRERVHFLRQIENDQCHTYMMLKIYLECSVLRPQQYPIDCRVVRLIVDHEYDEIATGCDMLADGSYDKEKKNAIGLAFAKKCYAGYPLELQRAYLEDLEAFQNEEGNPCFMADKFEFPMGLIYRIIRGKKPTKITKKIYDNKKNRKKSSDEKYSKKIGSKWSHDIVFASTLDRTRGIPGRDAMIILMELAYCEAKLKIPKGMYQLY